MRIIHKNTCKQYCVREAIDLNDFRRPPFGLVVFLCGFNFLYLLPLIFPASRYETSFTNYFRYYYLSYLMMVVGGIFEHNRNGWRFVNRHPFWWFFGVVLLAQMAFQAYMEDLHVLRIAIYSIPYLYLFLLGEMGGRRENLPWIWWSIILQTIIALFFAANFYSTYGFMSKAELFATTGWKFMSMGNYACIFLLLMLPLQRIWLFKVVTASSIALHLINSLLTYHRLTWILLPLELLLLLVLLKRTNSVKIPPPALFFSLFASAFISVVMMFMAEPSMQGQQPSDGAFERAKEKTLKRFETDKGQDRLYEVKHASSQMELDDWFIGRGLAARWETDNEKMQETRRGIHFTYYFHIFRGGIPLLLIMCYPLRWILIVLMKSRDALPSCAAAFMLIVFIMAISFNILSPNCFWALSCIMIGICEHEYSKITGRV